MFRQRLASIVIGLYLVATAIAAVLGVVSDDIHAIRPFGVSLHFSWEIDEYWQGERGLGVTLLVGTLAVNVWTLRQVFTLPPRAPRPADPRVRWLRRLLYLAVADVLVLGSLTDLLLPDRLADTFTLLVWGPMQVLFALALTGVLRGLALTLAVLDVLGMAVEVADEFGADIPNAFEILDLVYPFWLLLILIGQHRDGRWHRTTTITGWTFLITALVLPYVALALERFRDIPTFSIFTALAMFTILNAAWMARSAHELHNPDPTPTAPRQRSGGLRLLPAVAVLIPVLTLVHPEETARLTYTGWEDECMDWTVLHKKFGDTRPQDRDKAFLCLARSTMDGVPPMFDDTVPDQRILAYGRRLCDATTREEQEALLTQAGSPRPAWGADPSDLVFICPGKISEQQPHLLNSEAAEKASAAAWIAEENAKCTDPWPKVRAKRQGTAAYFLFEGGGYSVFDANDDSEEDSFSAAIDDGFVAVTGSSASVMTYNENEPICLTAKAFPAAPPLHLKGWNEVTELSILSRTGHLGIPVMEEGMDEGAGISLPNLALNGPGRYRLRVYARGEEFAPEQHLIVIYPGHSTKKIVYRQ
ncbi:hypothetical protein ABGB08_29200 [Acrocarpospora sp. B8E8]